MTRMASMNDKGGGYRAGTSPTMGEGREGGPVSKGGFDWAKSLKRKLTGEAVSQKLLLVVTSQLAVMLASGCDLCAGLEALSKQQARPRLKLILSDLHQGVKQGQSFSQALARYPEVFSDLYVTMVRAGESAGLLKHMLQTLQIMIRNQMRIVSSIRGALMYPVILISVALGAITVMTTFVLPRFAAVFESSHMPMPATTMFVIGTSKFVRDHFMLLGIGLVATLVGIIWMMHHPSVRDQVHKLALKVPILGPTLQL